MNSKSIWGFPNNDGQIRFILSVSLCWSAWSWSMETRKVKGVFSVNLQPFFSRKVATTSGAHRVNMSCGMRVMPDEQPLCIHIPSTAKQGTAACPRTSFRISVTWKCAESWPVLRVRPFQMPWLSVDVDEVDIDMKQFQKLGIDGPGVEGKWKVKKEWEGSCDSIWWLKLASSKSNSMCFAFGATRAKLKSFWIKFLVFQLY